MRCQGGEEDDDSDSAERAARMRLACIGQIIHLAGMHARACMQSQRRADALK